MAVHIRIATPDDAPQIQAIYAPYVLNTAVTYEYDVPTEAEFRRRIEKTLARYPYLVAEENGELLGYAYTGTFIGRSASDWSAETSIYLREDASGKGLGRRLYEALEEISKQQNLLNLNAAIAYPEVEDEHLTYNSVAFHSRLGFREVGRFHHCGYKFGTWYDLLWMEKWIGVHTASPLPVRPFPEIEKNIKKCLDKF